MQNLKRDNEIQLLKGCSLFNRLEPAQLYTLAARLRPVSYKRNETIFVKGSLGDALYIIDSGRVKISVPGSDGRDLIINIYGEGEVFGEMSLFDGLPRSADASALTKLEAWMLSRMAFEELLQTVPGLAQNIITLLSRRLRYTTEQTEMLGLLGAYDRVALKLLQMAQRSPESGQMVVTLSQQELGAMLGLTREWINKVLRAFADQGAIELGWGKIIILNPETLEQWF